MWYTTLRCFGVGNASVACKNLVQKDFEGATIHAEIERAMVSGYHFLCVFDITKGSPCWIVVPAVDGRKRPTRPVTQGKLDYRPC